MTTGDECIGVFGEEGCDNISVLKEQQINSEHHHSAMVNMQVSEKAKEWFRRKPYEIRSGASGQEHIKSVSSITTRDSEAKKGY